MSSAPPSLFPMFVRLHGRRCLVVGAGPVAESKIQTLLQSGAVVRVVAPLATSGIEQAAREGRVRWEAREFRASDLEGMFLVVAAASSPEVHEAVRREAVKLGVLCNIVDDPDGCDFFYPSIVRRGLLQVAISTSGQSPALARRLRLELEQELPAEYAGWVEYLGRVRRRLLRRIGRERANELLHRLASEERFQRFIARHRKTGA